MNASRALLIARCRPSSPLPVFLGDVVRMGWPGQLNLDLPDFLILSAPWLTWLHRFSASPDAPERVSWG